MSNEKTQTFLKEMEDYMIGTKKLSMRSVRIYLGKIRGLLEETYSVADLCGEADTLRQAYGAKGQLYDPKDHGKTKAAVGHVDDLVRKKLLEETSLSISYEKGWESFPGKGCYEAGYRIEDGMITFCYNRSFEEGKRVKKRIPTKLLRHLIDLLQAACNKGCLSPSDTCLHMTHGEGCRYAYVFGDEAANNCLSLFAGDSTIRLRSEYDALIEKMRS